MRIVLVVLAFGVTLGTAVPTQKVIGGSAVSINNYPETVSLLRSFWGFYYNHYCGGTIINQRSVLTAANCVIGDLPYQFRVRAGSSYYNNGGQVYYTSRFTIHTNYTKSNHDNDIAILHTSPSIIYGNLVKPANIAGANYDLGENEILWAVGWGATYDGGSYVEQLRHTIVSIVNAGTCKSYYAQNGFTITDNMLCVTGNTQCLYDEGSPVYDNNMVVGFYSWNMECESLYPPSINTRISKYETWISNVA